MNYTMYIASDNRAEWETLSLKATANQSLHNYVQSNIAIHKKIKEKLGRK